jgi:hypothetical protein
MESLADTKGLSATTPPTTVTLADALALPPGPVHVKMNVLVAKTRLLEVSEPLVGFVPDHDPDAEHDVALVDDQERLTASKRSIVARSEVSDTVGVGLGGVGDTGYSTKYPPMYTDASAVSFHR